MSKRIIAFLVTIALVMSMLPLAALAEETVTPDEVGEAIDQAQLSALKAGVANDLSGEVQTAVDEVLAAANEQLAENKLNEAESIVEGTNADNAERAEKAEDAAEDAADAADKAAEDAANGTAIPETFKDFLAKYVYNCADQDALLDVLGGARLMNLKNEPHLGYSTRH